MCQGKDEKKIYFGIVHCNLSEKMKRLTDTPERPIPFTPFELECKDENILEQYRICLAKCWAEHDEYDRDGTIAGIKAVDMMIQAGLVKFENGKLHWDATENEKED